MLGFRTEIWLTLLFLGMGKSINTKLYAIKEQTRMKKIKAIILCTIISLMMTGCKNVTEDDQQIGPIPSIGIDNSNEDITTEDISTDNMSKIDDMNMEDDNRQLLAGLESGADKEGAEEIRTGYIGEKLFHVNFKAITKPVSEALASYYSDMESQRTFSYSSRIPQELVDFIVEAMEAGKEEETFASIEVGTILGQEEYCNLTGLTLYGMKTVSPVKVDADNDGTDDLIGLFYGGGTGGFSTMELYKFSDKEGYTKTSSFECFLQDFKLISYQGKNYLLMKEFDYNTKYYSGYTLYLYEGGVLADGINFSFDIQDYEIDITYEDSSFSGMALIKSTLINKNLPNILNNNDGVIYGNGESIYEADDVAYRYSSDIDNDGKLEYYNKSMWFPSNMGTVMQCIYDFEESNVLQDLCESLDDEVGKARLYTFWLDKVNDKNILYLYYGENLDFSLYAYMLRGSK